MQQRRAKLEREAREKQLKMVAERTNKGDLGELSDSKTDTKGRASQFQEFPGML